MLDLSGYKAYLEAHDKTTRTPIQALSAFAAWLESEQMPLALGLSLAGIMAYAGYIKRRHLSPRSRSTYIAALSGFYRYAVRAGLVTVSAQELETTRQELNDLLNDLGRTIRKDPLHKRLPPAEVVAQVLDAARQVHEGEDATQYLDQLRDRALILSLASTGARVSEIAGLKRGDLDDAARSAEVTGKGGKRRTVYFNREAWDAIQEYFKYRLDEVYPKNAVYNAVFATQDRKNGKPIPISVRQIQRIVRAIAVRAGVDFHLTPHAFRHYVATEFLRKSGDLAMTQDLLGHASPNTTRIYASVDGEALHKKHGDIFDAKV